MKKIDILSLLVLVVFLPSLSLALDKHQEGTLQAHTISIGEYCDCLNSNLMEDAQEHYNPETMSEEIQFSCSQDRFHAPYSVREGIDPQSRMLGLAKSDADFLCNCVEATLAVNSSTSVNTYSVKLDPTYNDNGTFEVRVEERTAPFMMLRHRVSTSKEKKGGDNIDPATDRLSTADQTAQHRREDEETDSNPNLSSSTLVGDSSEQELSFRKKVAAALETLKVSDPIFNRGLRFVGHERSKQSIAYLRYLNTVDFEVIIESLMSTNLGPNFLNATLIVNGRPTLFEFAVRYVATEYRSLK